MEKSKRDLILFVSRRLVESSARRLREPQDCGEDHFDQPPIVQQTPSRRGEEGFPSGSKRTKAQLTVIGILFIQLLSGLALLWSRSFSAHNVNNFIDRDNSMTVKKPSPMANCAEATIFSTSVTSPFTLFLSFAEATLAGNPIDEPSGGSDDVHFDSTNNNIPILSPTGGPSSLRAIYQYPSLISCPLPAISSTVAHPLASIVIPMTVEVTQSDLRSGRGVATDSEGKVIEYSDYPLSNDTRIGAFFPRGSPTTAVLDRPVGTVFEHSSQAETNATSPSTPRFIYGTDPIEDFPQFAAHLAEGKDAYPYGEDYVSPKSMNGSSIADNQTKSSGRYPPLALRFSGLTRLRVDTRRWTRAPNSTMWISGKGEGSINDNNGPGAANSAYSFGIWLYTMPPKKGDAYQKMVIFRKVLNPAVPPEGPTDEREARSPSHTFPLPSNFALTLSIEPVFNQEAARAGQRQYCLQTETPESGSGVCTGLNSVVFGKWVHLSVTVTIQNIVYFYLNGRQIGNPSRSTAPFVFPRQKPDSPYTLAWMPDEIVFGGSSWSRGNPNNLDGYIGAMADFRVYNEGPAIFQTLYASVFEPCTHPNRRAATFTVTAEEKASRPPAEAEAAVYQFQYPLLDTPRTYPPMDGGKARYPLRNAVGELTLTHRFLPNNKPTTIVLAGEFDDTLFEWRYNQNGARLEQAKSVFRVGLAQTLACDAKSDVTLQSTFYPTDRAYESYTFWENGSQKTIIRTTGASLAIPFSVMQDPFSFPKNVSEYYLCYMSPNGVVYTMGHKVILPIVREMSKHDYFKPSEADREEEPSTVPVTTTTNSPSVANPTLTFDIHGDGIEHVVMRRVRVTIDKNGTEERTFIGDDEHETNSSSGNSRYSDDRYARVSILQERVTTTRDPYRWGADVFLTGAGLRDGMVFVLSPNPSCTNEWTYVFTSYDSYAKPMVVEGEGVQEVSFTKLRLQGSEVSHAMAGIQPVPAFGDNKLGADDRVASLFLCTAPTVEDALANNYLQPFVVGDYPNNLARAAVDFSLFSFTKQLDFRIMASSGGGRASKLFTKANMAKGFVHHLPSSHPSVIATAGSEASSARFVLSAPEDYAMPCGPFPMSPPHDQSLFYRYQLKVATPYGSDIYSIAPLPAPLSGDTTVAKWISVCEALLGDVYLVSPTRKTLEITHIGSIAPSVSSFTEFYANNNSVIGATSKIRQFPFPYPYAGLFGTPWRGGSQGLTPLNTADGRAFRGGVGGGSPFVARRRVVSNSSSTSPSSWFGPSRKRFPLDGRNYLGHWGYLSDEFPFGTNPIPPPESEIPFTVTLTRLSPVVRGSSPQGRRLDTHTLYFEKADANNTLFCYEGQVVKTRFAVLNDRTFRKPDDCSPSFLSSLFTAREGGKGSIESSGLSRRIFSTASHRWTYFDNCSGEVEANCPAKQDKESVNGDDIYLSLPIPIPLSPRKISIRNLLVNTDPVAEGGASFGDAILGVRRITNPPPGIQYERENSNSYVRTWITSMLTLRVRGDVRRPLVHPSLVKTKSFSREPRDYYSYYHDKVIMGGGTGDAITPCTHTLKKDFCDIADNHLSRNVLHTSAASFDNDVFVRGTQGFGGRRPFNENSHGADESDNDAFAWDASEGTNFYMRNPLRSNAEGSLSPRRWDRFTAIDLRSGLEWSGEWVKASPLYSTNRTNPLANDEYVTLFGSRFSFRNTSSSPSSPSSSLWRYQNSSLVPSSGLQYFTFAFYCPVPQQITIYVLCTVPNGRYVRGGCLTHVDGRKLAELAEDASVAPTSLPTYPMPPFTFTATSSESNDNNGREGEDPSTSTPLPPPPTPSPGKPTYPVGYTVFTNAGWHNVVIKVYSGSSYDNEFDSKGEEKRSFANGVGVAIDGNGIGFAYEVPRAEPVGSGSGGASTIFSSASTRSGVEFTKGSLPVVVRVPELLVFPEFPLLRPPSSQGVVGDMASDDIVSYYEDSSSSFTPPEGNKSEIVSVRTIRPVVSGVEIDASDGRLSSAHNVIAKGWVFRRLTDSETEGIALYRRTETTELSMFYVSFALFSTVNGDPRDAREEGGGEGVDKESISLNEYAMFQARRSELLLSFGRMGNVPVVRVYVDGEVVADTSSNNASLTSHGMCPPPNSDRLCVPLFLPRGGWHQILVKAHVPSFMTVAFLNLGFVAGQGGAPGVADGPPVRAGTRRSGYYVRPSIPPHLLDVPMVTDEFVVDEGQSNSVSFSLSRDTVLSADGSRRPAFAGGIDPLSPRGMSFLGLADAQGGLLASTSPSLALSTKLSLNLSTSSADRTGGVAYDPTQVSSLETEGPSNMVVRHLLSLEEQTWSGVGFKNPLLVGGYGIPYDTEVQGPLRDDYTDIISMNTLFENPNEKLAPGALADVAPEAFDFFPLKLQWRQRRANTPSGLFLSDNNAGSDFNRYYSFTVFVPAVPGVGDSGNGGGSDHAAASVAACPSSMDALIREPSDLVDQSTFTRRPRSEPVLTLDSEQSLFFSLTFNSRVTLWVNGTYLPPVTTVAVGDVTDLLLHKAHSRGDKKFFDMKKGSSSDDLLSSGAGVALASGSYSDTPRGRKETVGSKRSYYNFSSVPLNRYAQSCAHEGADAQGRGYFVPVVIRLSSPMTKNTDELTKQITRELEEEGAETLKLEESNFIDANADDTVVGYELMPLFLPTRVNENIVDGTTTEPSTMNKSQSASFALLMGAANAQCQSESGGSMSVCKLDSVCTTYGQTNNRYRPTNTHRFADRVVRVRVPLTETSFNRSEEGSFFMNRSSSRFGPLPESFVVLIDHERYSYAYISDKQSAKTSCSVAEVNPLSQPVKYPLYVACCGNAALGRSQRVPAPRSPTVVSAFATLRPPPQNRQKWETALRVPPTFLQVRQESPQSFLRATSHLRSDQMTAASSSSSLGSPIAPVTIAYAIRSPTFSFPKVVVLRPMITTGMQQIEKNAFVRPSISDYVHFGAGSANGFIPSLSGSSGLLYVNVTLSNNALTVFPSLRVLCRVDEDPFEAEVNLVDEVDASTALYLKRGFLAFGASVVNVYCRSVVPPDPTRSASRWASDSAWLSSSTVGIDPDVNSLKFVSTIAPSRVRCVSGANCVIQLLTNPRPRFVGFENAEVLTSYSLSSIPFNYEASARRFGGPNPSADASSSASSFDRPSRTGYVVAVDRSFISSPTSDLVRISRSARRLVGFLMKSYWERKQMASTDSNNDSTSSQASPSQSASPTAKNSSRILLSLEHSLSCFMPVTSPAGSFALPSRYLQRLEVLHRYQRVRGRKEERGAKDQPSSPSERDGALQSTSDLFANISLVYFDQKAVPVIEEELGLWGVSIHVLRPTADGDNASTDFEAVSLVDSILGFVGGGGRGTEVPKVPYSSTSFSHSAPRFSTPIRRSTFFDDDDAVGEVIPFVVQVLPLGAISDSKAASLPAVTPATLNTILNPQTATTAGTTQNGTSLFNGNISIVRGPYSSLSFIGGFESGDLLGFPELFWGSLGNNASDQMPMSSCDHLVPYEHCDLSSYYTAVAATTTLGSLSAKSILNSFQVNTTGRSTLTDAVAEIRCVCVGSVGRLYAGTALGGGGGGGGNGASPQQQWLRANVSAFSSIVRLPFPIQLRDPPAPPTSPEEAEAIATSEAFSLGPQRLKSEDTLVLEGLFVTKKVPRSLSTKMKSKEFGEVNENISSLCLPIDSDDSRSNSTDLPHLLKVTFYCAENIANTNNDPYLTNGGCSNSTPIGYVSSLTPTRMTIRVSSIAGNSGAWRINVTDCRGKIVATPMNSYFTIAPPAIQISAAEGDCASSSLNCVSGALITFIGQNFNTENKLLNQVVFLRQDDNAEGGDGVLGTSTEVECPIVQVEPVLIVCNVTFIDGDDDDYDPFAFAKRGFAVAETANEGGKSNDNLLSNSTTSSAPTPSPSFSGKYRIVVVALSTPTSTLANEVADAVDFPSAVTDTGGTIVIGGEGAGWDQPTTTATTTTTTTATTVTSTSTSTSETSLPVTTTVHTDTTNTPPPTSTTTESVPSTTEEETTSIVSTLTASSTTGESTTTQQTTDQPQTTSSTDTSTTTTNIPNTTSATEPHSNTNDDDAAFNKDGNGLPNGVTWALIGVGVLVAVAALAFAGIAYRTKLFTRGLFARSGGGRARGDSTFTGGEWWGGWGRSGERRAFREAASEQLQELSA